MKFTKIQWWNEIDFKGQHLTQTLYRSIIIIFALVGFLISILTKQFQFCGWSVLVGMSIAWILIIPPWPYLKKHPVKWVDKTE